MSINVAGDDRSKVSGSSIDIEIGARCTRTRSTPCTGGITSKTYRGWRSMPPNEVDAVHSVGARRSHELDCRPPCPGPHRPIHARGPGNWANTCHTDTYEATPRPARRGGSSGEAKTHFAPKQIVKIYCLQLGFSIKKQPERVSRAGMFTNWQIRDVMS